jgi:hypothetical protein
MMMAALAVMAAAPGCTRGPARKPMDEPMRIARDAAAAELAAGNYAAAAAEYQRALARAYVREDGRSAAAYRYQIAACELGLGKREVARTGFHDASVEALAAGDRRMAAQAEAAEARVALEAGKPAEARELAAKALARLLPAASPASEARLKAGLYLTLAEISALEGGERLGEAKKSLVEARQAQGKSKADPVFDAMAARVQGRILAAEPDKAGEAATAFDSESIQWRQAGRFSERAAALERAARQWKLAGKPDLAAERLIKAARIRFGLGQPVPARDLAGQAAELAGQAERADLAAMARILAPSAP